MSRAASAPAVRCLTCCAPQTVQSPDCLAFERPMGLLGLPGCFFGGAFLGAVGALIDATANEAKCKWKCICTVLRWPYCHLKHGSAVTCSGSHCACTHMHACMHPCMHACIHACTYTRAYTHACTHTCMHALVHACMHAHASVMGPGCSGQCRSCSRDATHSACMHEQLRTCVLLALIAPKSPLHMCAHAYVYCPFTLLRSHLCMRLDWEIVFQSMLPPCSHHAVMWTGPAAPPRPAVVQELQLGGGTPSMCKQLRACWCTPVIQSHSCV
jgi:hypothetical protein